MDPIRHPIFHHDDTFTHLISTPQKNPSTPSISSNNNGFLFVEIHRHIANKIHIKHV